MATKKKAAKAAKKPTSVKKIVPAKKAAAKPAQSSGGSKAGKKAPVSKSIAKPVAKKVAPLPPSKKTVPVPVKKPHHIAKPVVVKPVAGSVSKASSGASGAASKAPVPVAKPGSSDKQSAATTAAGVKQAPIIAGKSFGATPPPVTAPPITGPMNPMSKAEPKKSGVPAKPVKVVIPEMKTKTVRKYEPEFTKSVLDTPQEEQTGPTMRYSDAELGEFRELINRKLDAAKKELAYLQGLITRKDEMGGDNDDARYMTMEDGSMSMEREQLSQMASRQITFIDHLEKAIMRIENKTYGICRVTGKLIDKARLRAVPHATLSIEAKQMMNK
jgi:RNA polymerase-binding transcription factor DksA